MQDNDDPWQDPVWVRGRACAGLNPNVFVPQPGRPKGGGSPYAKAIAICVSCPVQPICAKHWLDDMSDLYVAGMTPQERKQRRKALALTAA